MLPYTSEPSHRRMPYAFTDSKQALKQLRGAGFHLRPPRACPELAKGRRAARLRGGANCGPLGRSKTRLRRIGDVPHGTRQSGGLCASGALSPHRRITLVSLPPSGADRPELVRRASGAAMITTRATTAACERGLGMDLGAVPRSVPCPRSSLPRGRATPRPSAEFVKFVHSYHSRTPPTSPCARSLSGGLRASGALSSHRTSPGRSQLSTLNSHCPTLTMRLSASGGLACNPGPCAPPARCPRIARGDAAPAPEI
jgi:hypothetical protein